MVREEREEGERRKVEGRNIQDILSRHHTEGRLTSDHESAEGCGGEGGDDRGRLWLQTILHHNQTHKHQVTLHHITVGVWEGGRCVWGEEGRDEGSRMYTCMQVTLCTCDLHRFSCIYRGSHRMTLSALCHGMCIVLCPTASTRNPL